MQFAGVLPEDAPDPRLVAADRLERVPFAVVGFAPQPSLEDDGWPGFTEGADASGTTELTVGLNYRLWRNPADRDDPVNLADLDERTRDALDEVPPWPRPAWLVAQVERMRYPQLWEVVRTSWHRDASEYHHTLEEQLVDHVNHILMNRFRDELALPPGPTTTTDWQVTTRSVRAGTTTTLDGEPVSAVELDTDPFVFGIGFDLAPGVVVTAAIPRAELEFVRVAFATVHSGTADASQPASPD